MTVPYLRSERSAAPSLLILLFLLYHLPLRFLLSLQGRLIHSPSHHKTVWVEPERMLLQTAPNLPALQCHLTASAFLSQVLLPSAPVLLPVCCCIGRSFQPLLKRSAILQLHIVCTQKNLSFSLFLTIHYLFLTIVLPHSGWFIRLFFISCL